MLPGATKPRASRESPDAHRSRRIRKALLDAKLIDSLKKNVCCANVAEMVRLGLVAWLAVVAASSAVSATSESSSTGGNSKRLQIGVKRRVEKCEARSRKGDVLHMHYRGTLEDGTEFDSSYNRGDPLTFTLGSGQVIRGWDQGLLAMCVGEKRKLVIPPDLAYGSRGAPPTIPGDATLTFEVELVKIDRKTEL